MSFRRSRMARLQLEVNGTRHSVEVEPGNRLLYVLRGQLGLHGPKFGCGLGQCGACTVLVDGAAVNSCLMAAADAAGHSVVTIEGLGTAANPHPLQQVFVEEQAAQCGYC